MQYTNENIVFFIKKSLQNNRISRIINEPKKFIKYHLDPTKNTDFSKSENSKTNLVFL